MNKAKNKIIILMLLLFGFSAIAAEVKIAAVVNGEIITSAEVSARVRLIKALAPLIEAKLPPEDALYTHMLDNMIDDIVRVQEAAKYKITADEKETSESIEKFAKFYNTTAEGLKALMAKEGIAEDTLKSQAKADVLWSKLTFQVLRAYVNASDREVDGVFAEQNGTSSFEYSLVPYLVAKPDIENAQKSVAGAKSCEEFAAVAREGGTGISGEKIVIMEVQMQPELKALAQGASVGDTLAPLAFEDTLTIFFVCDKQKKDITATDEDKARLKWSLLGGKLEVYSNKYFDRLRRGANVKKM
ncbi:MAG: SurA N-terminal domain-containing protein [Rickettsiales bacterium]|jgi:peptidyl-prolyl cis-trans isomerase SurA|nr:SurA N-terminal domain-containing protein [Rickettsiales bacterium]